jgi:hypothetical protein
MDSRGWGLIVEVEKKRCADDVISEAVYHILNLAFIAFLRRKKIRGIAISN